MYAIVKVGGKQFKVSENDTLDVPLLDLEEGTSTELKDVILFSKDGEVQIGAPTIANATISAKSLGMVKGNKLIVFKMKRRKGYSRKRGHRQRYTRILIEKINA